MLLKSGQVIAQIHRHETQRDELAPKPQLTLRIDNY